MRIVARDSHTKGLVPGRRVEFERWGDDVVVLVLTRMAADLKASLWPQQPGKHQNECASAINSWFYDDNASQSLKVAASHRCNKGVGKPAQIARSVLAALLSRSQLTSLNTLSSSLRTTSSDQPGLALQDLPLITLYDFLLSS